MKRFAPSEHLCASHPAVVFKLHPDPRVVSGVDGSLDGSLQAFVSGGHGLAVEEFDGRTCALAETTENHVLDGVKEQLHVVQRDTGLLSPPEGSGSIAERFHCLLGRRRGTARGARR